MRKFSLLVVAALLTGLIMTAAPTAVPAQVAVGISVRIGPPPLRVLAVQPIAPGPGYLWTPGYWAWSPAGYYWVPGAWELAPAPGLLWTPGYWGYGGDAYVWHAGYWGPHVGFYGGINYGFGYFGNGFAGGHWARGRFYYNTAVWRVNRTVIHTTYVDRTVIRNVQDRRVSYNGGPGGMRARANASEMRYARERRMQATPGQTRRESRARMSTRQNGRGRNRQPQAERRDQRRAKPNNKGKDKREKKDDQRGPGRI
ncbi:MAG: hypothetical protein ACRD1Y_10355 [Terriglobales bacterium]